ncbi:MAG: hypothetical protein Q7K55_09010 [Candidatus Levybacteria bacterium]|nr:hypothetical protein [Candidatus Levybacteria bacterium]
MIVQNSKFKVIFFFINFAFLIATFNFQLSTFNLGKAEASGLSLGISPSIIRIEASPPAEIKTLLTIQNLGDKAVELKIDLEPFRANDLENGEITYFADKSYKESLSIFKKIQILEENKSLEKLVLAPKQKKDLNLYISIPKDEKESDYYFSIIFKTGSASSELSDLNLLLESKEKNITANKRYTTGISNISLGVSLNVLLSIGKNVNTNGFIEEFSSPIFVESGPVPFTLRVKNSGRHLIVPKGNIFIKNMFGQTVGKIDLLPVNVLAGTIRLIPDISFYENGSLINLRSLWKEKLLFGHYSATLNISFSDDGQLFTKTVRFFALPAQGIAGFIIALIIVIIIRNRIKSKQY